MRGEESFGSLRRAGAPPPQRPHGIRAPLRGRISESARPSAGLPGSSPFPGRNLYRSGAEPHNTDIDGRPPLGPMPDIFRPQGGASRYGRRRGAGTPLATNRARTAKRGREARSPPRERPAGSRPHNPHSGEGPRRRGKRLLPVARGLGRGACSAAPWVQGPQAGTRGIAHRSPLPEGAGRFWWGPRGGGGRSWRPRYRPLRGPRVPVRPLGRSHGIRRLPPPLRSHRGRSHRRSRGSRRCRLPRSRTQTPRLQHRRPPHKR